MENRPGLALAPKRRRRWHYSKRVLTRGAPVPWSLFSKGGAVTGVALVGVAGFVATTGAFVGVLLGLLTLLIMYVIGAYRVWDETECAYSQLETLHGGAKVSRDHRDELRGLLADAAQFVGLFAPVAWMELEDGFQVTEFRAHFPVLAEQLARWNQSVETEDAAEGRLVKRFARELRAEALYDSPYYGDAIATRFVVITRERARADDLGSPLGSLWKPDTDCDHLMPYHVLLAGPGVNPAINMGVAQDEDDAEFQTRVRKKTAPLEALLAQAQGWPESEAVHTARKALRGLEGVRADLNALTPKESLPVAAGCPVCGDESC